MRTYTPTYTTISVTRGWKVSLLLFPLCALYLLNPTAHTVLDTVSALLYDAGRYAFEPMGGVWVHAGGTLGQIALPMALIIVFLAFEEVIGAQVGLFWLGHNLVNVSFNLAVFKSLHTNAVSRQDWIALLDSAGLAAVESHVGAIIFAVGCICFVLALIAPSYSKDF